MVKVTIIGWYGTETIGDRAILAGLVNVISASFGDFEIQLGALYPVLSERTIIEDYSFLKKCVSHDFNISIFNSTKVNELKKAVNWCDFLIVGGGPLMDLQAMYMLSYAFSYAHRKKKKTALLGCGWGPLSNPEFISCAKNLVQKSDLAIFRDSTSVTHYNEIVPGGKTEPIGLIDPAFIASSVFLNINKDIERDKQHICVNLRDMSYDSHYQSNEQVDLFAYFCNILNGLSNKYPEKQILLVPMHTFGVGGDDRLLLNKISRAINRSNVEVQNNPLSLEETMNHYYNAYFCVGMRFHSIVLQTILNGKNYILDYTNPTSGKIISMMRQLNLTNVYEDRYISLHTFGKQLEITEEIERIVVPHDFVEQYRRVYIQEVSKILG